MSEAIGRDEHDVYLIDYRLGEKDGIALIQEAIADGCVKPVIMLTGSADDGIDELAMKAGAADYLDKSQIGQIHSVIREMESEPRRRIARESIGDPLLESTIRHVLIRDETQKALRESERRFRELTDMLPLGLYELDTDGAVTFANRSALQSLGYDTIEKLNASGAMVPKDRDRRNANLQRRMRGENIGPQEMSLVRKDGSEFPVISDAAPIMDAGEIVGLRAFTLDITERKRNEDALKQARIAAEEANHAKSRFLNAMSHELRTPLNGILGFTELLAGRFFGPLNDKQSDYITLLERSGRHLLDLINDVLDVAKLDAGASELNREEFAPSQLIDNSVALMGPQLEKKGLVITENMDSAIDLISGDPRRCKQIMLNLLSNAMKYSPGGGSIDIQAKIVDGSMAMFSVSDQGPGIPAEKLGKIFDEFYQVEETRDSQLGGTGIGLELVKKLTELHGGKVGVESQVGEGATFWFTLPLASTDGPRRVREAKSLEPETAIPAKGSRILVVDDAEMNLTVFLDMLGHFGYEVNTARNGQEAIDHAQSSHPDAILMDMVMPVMDGLEATRRLRGMSEFSDLPIIALTGNADEESAKSCREAGFTMHLTKPVAMANLLGALERCLGEKDKVLS